MKISQYLRLIALLVVYTYLQAMLWGYRIVMLYGVYPLRVMQIYLVYYIGKTYILTRHRIVRLYIYIEHYCVLGRLYAEYAILMVRRQVLLTVQFAIVLIITFLFGGCANVTIVEAGAGRVQVITQAAAEDCTKLTETDVKVITKVGLFKRSPDQIQTEAENVARNAAKDHEGNAVAPLDSLSEDGNQQFGIYRC